LSPKFVEPARSAFQIFLEFHEEGLRKRFPNASNPDNLEKIATVFFERLTPTQMAKFENAERLDATRFENNEPLGRDNRLPGL
jgi:hypothetical protein